MTGRPQVATPDWYDTMRADLRLLRIDVEDTIADLRRGSGLPEQAPEPGGWRTLSEVAMKAIRFIEKPLWQQSAFHLVAGAKGCGKGTYLAREAARVTRGELGDKRNVIWIAAGEDSLSIDVAPRITVAGGELARVTFPELRLQLPEGVEAIREQARAVSNVGLVVLDPIVGMFPGGGKRSTNADTDVRLVLDPLNGLADELDCMVVGVRHLGKDRTRGALASVLGSVDWVNVPRAVLAVAIDDEDKNVRHVQVIAGNRVPHGEAGLSFRILGVTIPELGEDAEPVTRAQLLGRSQKDVETLLGPSQPERAGKRDVARDVILRELATGPKPLNYLKAAAAAEGSASGETAWRAANELKTEGRVKTYQERNDDGTAKQWLWRLATATSSSSPATSSSSLDTSNDEVDTKWPIQAKSTSSPLRHFVTSSVPGGTDEVDEDEVERLADIARKLEDES